jgi:aminoglycoside phosphotransferase (APT) family kinase protein
VAGVGGATAPLRAIDWRFVMPAPLGGRFEALLLLGAGDDVAQRVLETGLARQVLLEPPHAGGVDAIVALHTASAQVVPLVALLRPGGTLYLEAERKLSRSRFVTPRSLEGVLRASGLTPMGSYAIAPHPSRAMLYLPLGARGAMRWYMTTVFNPSTPQRRLIELGLSGARWIGQQRIASLWPYFAVTAVAGPSSARAASVLADDGVRAQLPRERLLPLVLADAGNRAVVLPFTGAGAAPVAVLKVPKLPVFNERTENEQRTLVAIRRSLNGDLLRTVPDPRGVVDWNGVSVALESYTDGEPLKRSSGRWGARLSSKLEDLRLAADWLGEFHSQTAFARSLWSPQHAEDWILRPLDDYEQAFGATAGERQLFERCRSEAAALVGSQFCTVWHHRDFNVWNVFRADGEARVIDWEGGRPGPPLCDLLHFSMHWNEVVKRKLALPRALDAFRSLFLQRNVGDRAGAAVHEAIASYMRRVNVDSRFVPLLLVYTTVELALRRRTQLRDQGERLENPRGGNRSIAFVELLAEKPVAVFELRPSISG